MGLENSEEKWRIWKETAFFPKPSQSSFPSSFWVLSGWVVLAFYFWLTLPHPLLSFIVSFSRKTSFSSWNTSMEETSCSISRAVISSTFLEQRKMLLLLAGHTHLVGRSKGSSCRYQLILFPALLLSCRGNLGHIIWPLYTLPNCKAEIMLVLEVKSFLIPSMSKLNISDMQFTMFTTPTQRWVWSKSLLLPVLFLLPQKAF